mmetsp:Transcript_55696/g.130338  ORF Transcript_55696/g.130338 Transcript_55696/m.130338 type:complete len:202 (+) Transcript_55696:558-1163(+)
MHGVVRVLYIHRRTGTSLLLNGLSFRAVLDQRGKFIRHRAGLQRVGSTQGSCLAVFPHCWTPLDNLKLFLCSLLLCSIFCNEQLGEERSVQGLRLAEGGQYAPSLWTWLLTTGVIWHVPMGIPGMLFQHMLSLACGLLQCCLIAILSLPGQSLLQLFLLLHVLFQKEQLLCLDVPSTILVHQGIEIFQDQLLRMETLRHGF